MNKEGYSPKVLEMVAREIGNYFTGNEIVRILTEFGMTREVIQYPNTKWWTINEAFKYIKTNHEKPDNSISKLIMVFIHPLNHNLNAEKTEKIADRIGKYLKYNDFSIKNTGKEYVVLSNTEIHNRKHAYEQIVEEIQTVPQEIIDDYRSKMNDDDTTIMSEKYTIKTLRDNHQTYIDVIEIFCQETTKPTKELNDAYIFLSKKIETIIRKLKLQFYEIVLYKPFKDLYAAEIEWNGSGNGDDLKLGPKLSWDAIRPSLYSIHSKIIEIYNISEGHTQMTSDEKKLEGINNLISEKRIQKKPIQRDDVKKIEILHKYEKGENKFYITKKDDDFYYKGQYLKLSKKSEYYKIFCSLFSKLPEGGEITYQELSKEIVSRIPKAKNKSEEEMRKLIQDNLTGKKNGFVRYAKIPASEDNGKPLIETVRASGIAFNNRRG
jgi:hypothetical protein